MSSAGWSSSPCGFPGCARPARPSSGRGRPPVYCDDPDHNSLRATRLRQQQEHRQGGPHRGPARHSAADLAAELAAAQALNAKLAGQLHDALNALERSERELGELRNRMETATPRSGLYLPQQRCNSPAPRRHGPAPLQRPPNRC